ncbi:cell wall anchor protein [uncultured Chryseobacterium sp.]|jgi:hypothetical protein|uniref:cell wall anchor protein n=1 Tax=uncultured Chryseobacterium sp. TaxID=259322 RepID=UPI00260B2E7E|nr:cell wall anchor protein [uncultured Chryseobacterium sp.]
MKQKLLSLALLASTFTFAQSWNLTGNTGTNPSTSYLGTSDAKDLIFKTNNTERLNITSNGNFIVKSNDGYGGAILTLDGGTGNGILQITKSGCNGCYGLDKGGTMFRNMGGSHTMVFHMPNNDDDGSSFIGFGDDARGTWIKFFNNGIARFDGKIKAKEVEVKANVWADYVFKKEYQLKSLEDVEKHITEKGHLPNIPSADEVAKNGINLGEMDAKLLEKIEELTLYSIQQNKQLKSQSEEIAELKKQVEQLLSTKK